MSQTGIAFSDVDNTVVVGAVADIIESVAIVSLQLGMIILSLTIQNISS